MNLKESTYNLYLEHIALRSLLLIKHNMDAKPVNKHKLINLLNRESIRLNTLTNKIPKESINSYILSNSSTTQHYQEILNIYQDLINNLKVTHPTKSFTILNDVLQKYIHHTYSFLQYQISILIRLKKIEAYDQQHPNQLPRKSH